MMISSYYTMLYSTSKSKWIRDYYLAKYGLEKTTQRFNSIADRNLLTPDEIQLIMRNRILSGEPLFIGRFGSIELLVSSKVALNIKYKMNYSLDVLCNNAGFFPNDIKLLEQYSDTMLHAMNLCDIQGVWYLPFEDYAIKNWLNKNALLTEIRYLEPWFSNNPWTEALSGKKVLVIHPFEETIKSQYKNRKTIFENTLYLPEFELCTVKAVQTIAGTIDNRFSTWFDALDYMFDEAMNQDFDIALIGCGAYGYPLAAKIKEAGKQAIHMGGVLQAMFGIKGKRWEVDPNPIVRNLYNDSWVRPNQFEIPKNKDKVEEGCYW